MIYTAQRLANTGNWAAPAGDDIESLCHCCSRADVNESLEGWADTVGRLDPREVAYFIVWTGEHYSDVTDLYPDFKVSYGPRGGIRWESV